jgi:hypothetical protein
VMTGVFHGHHAVCILPLVAERRAHRLHRGRGLGTLVLGNRSSAMTQFKFNSPLTLTRNIVVFTLDDAAAFVRSFRRYVHRADERHYGFFWKVRIISLKADSCTAAAASADENHWTWRLPFSRQVFCCRFTSSRKTWTSQATSAPCLSRF